MQRKFSAGEAKICLLSSIYSGCQSLMAGSVKVLQSQHLKPFFFFSEHKKQENPFQTNISNFLSALAWLSRAKKWKRGPSSALDTSFKTQSCTFRMWLHSSLQNWILNEWSLSISGGSSHLSHHPIPDVVDLLAMLAIGYQVQVIGELDILCNLLQNVDAEAFAALLDVRPTSLCCVAAETQNEKKGIGRLAIAWQMLWTKRLMMLVQAEESQCSNLQRLKTRQRSQFGE